jgi:hypothetical protein
MNSGDGSTLHIRNASLNDGCCLSCQVGTCDNDKRTEQWREQPAEQIIVGRIRAMVP